MKTSSKQENEKKTIHSFLQSHSLATISTSHHTSGNPEAALIAYAETDELEIIFETLSDARKYRNLLNNPHVALVIGWDPEHHITLQYEGKAFPIDEDQVKKYRDIFRAKKTPCTDEFLFHPKVKFFIIRPTWIGFSDYTTSPPKITELFFD